jgi:hypothetical protein
LVHVQTIQNYDFKGKDYKIPPYNFLDRSTKAHFSIKNNGHAYQMYSLEEEKFYDKELGEVALMKASWEKTLKPLFTLVICYCIKFWHLSPWLSHKEPTKRVSNG